ncbi:uncharacterized protein LOC115347585 isoform X3 [Aquila chrysaetos chrysaetos]|uniref:uncharacterized protein LOC115347585 isoform X3 n=1 Tax=Aquila chrysaetos chrysaetos TaxID=223781 RepID=UPI0011768258|nr:uncharacterized protein LOC115347585 isoform X3 [Aquila chrysaetos chrysaetos]
MQDVWRRPATGRSAWERSCPPRGSACAREGPHRRFAVRPFAALGRLERAAQIFHPPPGWVPPPALEPAKTAGATCIVALTEGTGLLQVTPCIQGPRCLPCCAVATQITTLQPATCRPSAAKVEKLAAIGAGAHWDSLRTWSWAWASEDGHDTQVRAGLHGSLPGCLDSHLPSRNALPQPHSLRHSSPEPRSCLAEQNPLEGDLWVVDARSKLWWGKGGRGRCPKPAGLMGGICSCAGRESLEVRAATLSLPPLALQDVRAVSEGLGRGSDFAPADPILAHLRPRTLLKQAVPQAGESADKPRESSTRAEDVSDGGRQDTQPT